MLKTILPKSVLLLMLFSAVLSGCSSDDDSSSSDQEDYNLTAKVDGVDFLVEDIIISAFNGIGEYYTIFAVGEASIGLTLKSPLSLGTFATGVEEEVAMTYQTNVPFAVWGASDDIGSGSINITVNNDTYIKGTFSFTGFNAADNTSKVISEGKFKAQKI